MLSESIFLVTVLSMGFSPRQVHYGFSETKEMTVEHSWGERVIPNFIPTVAGQSLESCPLRASLHAAGRSLPPGPSARCSHLKSLSSVLPLLQPLLSCSRAAAIPRCHPEHWAELFIESITTYCPHMCSELASQGQGRILALGTFTLSTLHASRICLSI